MCIGTNLHRQKQVVLLENRRFWSKTVNTVGVVREWNKFRIRVQMGIRNRYTGGEYPASQFPPVKTSGTPRSVNSYNWRNHIHWQGLPCPHRSLIQLGSYIHVHGQFKIMETRVLSGQQSRRITDIPFRCDERFDVRVGSTKPLTLS